ncbi:putative ga4 desaturase family protein [Podospora aff. communis PSN243]|uniref:Ga4 desaturase family protein n=1 Tax=Podospora aff. communis PSN243 TaxID=3040156 RepID=A0AAV9G9P6_9PEZI|nr:putative ga4 desaturase family protein [Podospora aff. communis PSN243]
MTDPIEATARTTTANLNYLLPGPDINRRFVSAGVEVNTGTYGPYPTTIRDGRTIRHHFTFNKHGFQLLDAPTSITNFHDKTEVEAHYQSEVAAYVKKAFNADFVYAQGWMLRTSGTIPKREEGEGDGRKPYRHYGGLQPAAGEVHVDTEPSRQWAYAKRVYERARPEGPGFKRFVMSSFWRAFSGGVQDCPLAVCDAGSVGDDEGVPNVLWVVDKIPEGDDMFKPMDDDAQLAAAIFRHNPDHRWWYFSGMQKDEALLFKFHDSDSSVGWRVPHSAFWDDSFPETRTVRESIECRTIAFFEN